jgi:hypothetical protein
MSERLAQCQACTHYQQIEGTTFLCKLHDQNYSVNQESCEDFEDKEHYESTSYECD